MTSHIELPPTRAVKAGDKHKFPVWSKRLPKRNTNSHAEGEELQSVVKIDFFMNCLLIIFFHNSHFTMVWWDCKWILEVFEKRLKYDMFHSYF